MLRRAVDRHGVALLMALVAVVLVEAGAAMAVSAAMARIRLGTDERRAVEARLVVASALADGRVVAVDTLGKLADGETRSVVSETRPDGWRVTVLATRSGAVIRLSARVDRLDAAGRRVAARRATLLLVRVAADTVRVLQRHPRF
jgi:hypothetical protein